MRSGSSRIRFGGLGGAYLFKDADEVILEEYARNLDKAGVSSGHSIEWDDSGKPTFELFLSNGSYVKATVNRSSGGTYSIESPTFGRVLPQVPLQSALDLFGGGDIPPDGGNARNTGVQHQAPEVNAGGQILTPTPKESVPASGSGWPSWLPHGAPSNPMDYMQWLLLLLAAGLSLYAIDWATKD